MENEEPGRGRSQMEEEEGKQSRWRRSSLHGRECRCVKTKGTGAPHRGDSVNKNVKERA